MRTTTTGDGRPASGPAVAAPPAPPKERPELARRWIHTLVFAAIAVIVGLPLIWLLAGSIGLPEGVTLEGFADILQDPKSLEALTNTLVLALGVGILSGALGIPLAWITARTDMPGKGLIPVFCAVAYMIPAYLAAIAYIMLASPRAGILSRLLRDLLGTDEGFINIYSMGGIIFVISLTTFPIVFFIAWAALLSVDPSLEQAAAITGAGRWAILRRVTIPVVAPAISGGLMLAAVNSLALFGPQLFLGTPANIEFLTTRLFRQMRSFPPETLQASGLSITLIVLTVAGLIVQNRLIARRSYTTVGGRAGARDLTRLGKWNALAIGYSVVVVAMAVALPFGLMLIASFSENWLAPSITSLTLDNYRTVLFEQDLSRRGLVNSLIFAAVSATVALVLGFFVSYLVIRVRTRSAKLLDYVAIVPLGLPGTVMGLGLIAAWARIPVPVYATAVILVIAYIARNLPYSVRTVNGALRQIDPALEEAARITGATWLQGIRHIVSPIIRPSLLIGWVLVFIPSLGELSATILLYSSGNETVSIAILRLQERGSFELLSALSVVLIVITLIALWVFRKLAGGKSLSEVFGADR